MDSIGAVVAAILLAILLVGGAAVAQISYQESGENQKELTETFDAGAAGTIVTFNESNKENIYYYDDTVTVVSKNNKQYEQGQDYNWIQSNGTLEVLDGDMDNTNDNEITYSFRSPSREQDAFAERVSLIFETAQWLPLVLIFLLVMLVAGSLGRGLS
jgi:hypothetical protein